MAGMTIELSEYVIDAIAEAVVKKMQEPKTDGDCISRDIVLEKMADYVSSGYADSAEDFEEYSKIICQLPSVQPKAKTGHWIDGHCSECGCDAPAYIIDWKWQKDMDAKYCPNCGCKMSEIPTGSESESSSEKPNKLEPKTDNHPVIIGDFFKGI